MSASYPENLSELIEKIGRMINHYADGMKADAVRSWKMAQDVAKSASVELSAKDKRIAELDRNCTGLFDEARRLQTENERLRAKLQGRDTKIETLRAALAAAQEGEGESDE